MAKLLAPALWVILLAAAMALPFSGSGYAVSLGVSILGYVALATAWAFFSGPTRYASLATGAFVGIGVYCVAVIADGHPLWVALLAAPLAGAALALVVGVATLRLRGVYFVIFTFGLTELVKQLVTWWEINRSKTLTRFIWIEARTEQVYFALLAVAAFAMLASWWVNRSRIGIALRTIGEDETVARHAGINVTAMKVLSFMASAATISLVGAILALRYASVDPQLAFNSLWSFQVLIMALLGGMSRTWGPAIGVVPLVLLSEVLAGTLPHHFGIALGLCFMVVVYFIPGGITWQLEALRRMRAARSAGNKKVPA